LTDFSSLTKPLLLLSKNYYKKAVISIVAAVLILYWWIDSYVFDRTRTPVKKITISNHLYFVWRVL